MQWARRVSGCTLRPAFHHRHSWQTVYAAHGNHLEVPVPQRMWSGFLTRVYAGSSPVGDAIELRATNGQVTGLLNRREKSHAGSIPAGNARLYFEMVSHRDDMLPHTPTR